jgi:hypothetical protein
MAVDLRHIGGLIVCESPGHTDTWNKTLKVGQFTKNCLPHTKGNMGVYCLNHRSKAAVIVYACWATVSAYGAVSGDISISGSLSSPGTSVPGTYSLTPSTVQVTDASGDFPSTISSVGNLTLKANGSTYISSGNFVINFGTVTINGQSANLTATIASGTEFDYRTTSGKLDTTHYYFNYIGDIVLSFGGSDQTASVTVTDSANGSVGRYTIQIQTGFTPVPEPSTYLAGIAGMGLLGMFFLRRQD